MRRFLVLITIMFWASIMNAQDSIVEKTADTIAHIRHRPKVGVVLSGGGAKGFAHIGALRVIEKAGIPIDYIAGTSMGSFVGGLYAVGYSPDMMEKLCTEQNWDLIIKDQVPRKFMPLEKRYNERHYLVTMPYKNGKIKIKRSIIDGVYVNMLLTRLMMPAYKEREFDSLPIPFLCIGTDMISSDAIEFRKGSLAQAVRSSMSIPFLFEPVEYDEYLLCDGGLTNNFPVQNVRKEGADIIIGVDLEIIKSDPDVLDNSLKVLERLIAVVSQDKSNVARDQCDILIRPDIGKANIMSFNDFDPIIKCGENGADEKFDELKRLADSLQAIEPFEPKRFNTQPVDSIMIDKVEVVGLEGYESNIIKEEFGAELPRMFSIDEIETIIVKIYSTGYYSNVWYEMVDSPEGNVLRVHSKNNTSLNFSIGGHYDNNYGIGILLNMNARTTHFIYNVDLNVSDNPYFKASATNRYTKMLRSTLEISAMRIRANLFNSAGNIISALSVQRNTADLSFKFVPSVTQMFRVGARADYSMIKDRQHYDFGELVDIEDMMVYKHHFYPNFYLQYFFNNEDQTDFPRKGWNINAIARCYMYEGVFSNEYNKPSFSVQAEIRKTFALGKSNALSLGGVGAFRLGDEFLINEYMFFIGGQSKMRYVDNIFSFTGLPFVSISTEYAAFAKSSWQWNFYKNFYSIVSCDAGYFKDINTMDIYELLDEILENRFDNIFVPTNFVMGAGLTLGWKTLLGPIEVQVSKSNIHDDWNLFVNVGYWF